jgi:hypothetical protein
MDVQSVLIVAGVVVNLIVVISAAIHHSSSIANLLKTVEASGAFKQVVTAVEKIPIVSEIVTELQPLIKIATMKDIPVDSNAVVLAVAK